MNEAMVCIETGAYANPRRIQNNDRKQDTVMEIVIFY